VQRFALRGADDFDTVRPALVGDVRVELDARIIAVAGVHVGLRLASPAGPEKDPIISSAVPFSPRLRGAPSESIAQPGSDNYPCAE
jgi:hypothetical protein